MRNNLSKILIIMSASAIFISGILMPRSFVLPKIMFSPNSIEQSSAKLISAINNYANKLNIADNFSNVSSASLSKIDDASPAINEILDMAVEIPQFFGEGILNSISYVSSAMFSIAGTTSLASLEFFKTEFYFSQFLGEGIIGGASTASSATASLLFPVKDFWQILANSFLKW